MALRRETVGLQNPSIGALPRLSDQISFLYITDAKIVQDSTGVVAVSDKDGAVSRTSIPVASVASLLLGHGTSITQPALTTLSKHAVSLVWVGADASRTHGWSYSLTTSARWVEAQATLWANKSTRRDVAIAMYRRRFGPDVAPDGVTIKQLRGLEGHRMKELYRRLSDQHGLSFKRAYKPDDFYSSDPINQALSSANAALYGVVTAAVVALGCHPGLGFIHAGNVSSFVFDIADLYKAEVSVPAAFAASGHSNPGRAALRLTRSAIVEQRLLSRAVTDIQTLLEPGLHSASPSESLLRNDEGFATGGTLYGIDGSPSDPTWQT